MTPIGKHIALTIIAVVVTLIGYTALTFDENETNREIHVTVLDKINRTDGTIMEILNQSGGVDNITKNSLDHYAAFKGHDQKVYMMLDNITKKLDNFGAAQSPSINYTAVKGKELDIVFSTNVKQDNGTMAVKNYNIKTEIKNFTVS